MNIQEAIIHIGNKLDPLKDAVKPALESEQGMINFTNYIVDQYRESEGNKNRLIKLFGLEAINEVLLWSKKKAIEHDFIVMNESLRDEH